MKLRKFEKAAMENASRNTCDLIEMIRDARSGMSYLEMIRKYPDQMDKVDFATQRA